MYAVTYFITFSLMSILLINADDYDPTYCLNNDEKAILNKFKGSQEITPLLQGKTFTDIWRRKESADFVDCSLTEFKLEDDKLKVEMHKEDHEPIKYIYHETWTERKGQEQIEVVGVQEFSDGTHKYAQTLQFFYIDENAFGVFSCGLGDFRRLIVAVRKDKQGDKATEESLKKAEQVMHEVKLIIPNDEMVKLTQLRCPDKV